MDAHASQHSDDGGRRRQPSSAPYGDESPVHGAAASGAPSTASHEYVEACIMLSLGERPAYGYQLKGELDELGLQNLERGRIYRVLRSMEAVGLAVSRWETATRGPARRTYELTAHGYELLGARALVVRRQRRQLRRFPVRYERIRPAESDAVA